MPRRRLSSDEGRLQGVVRVLAPAQLLEAEAEDRAVMPFVDALGVRFVRRDVRPLACRSDRAHGSPSGVVAVARSGSWTVSSSGSCGSDTGGLETLGKPSTGAGGKGAAGGVATRGAAELGGADEAGAASAEAVGGGPYCGRPVDGRMSRAPAAGDGRRAVIDPRTTRARRRVEAGTPSRLPSSIRTGAGEPTSLPASTLAGRKANQLQARSIRLQAPTAPATGRTPVNHSRLRRSGGMEASSAMGRRRLCT
jgi:hypothetical protein